MAQRKDFEVKRGDYAETFKFTFPFDCTGHKLIMTAKKSLKDDDDDAIFKKELEDVDFESISPTESVAIVTFDESEDDLDTVDRFVYDVVLVDADDKPLTYLVGDFVISEHATKEIA